MRWPEPHWNHGTPVLFDPCAGEGAAIAELARLWSDPEAEYPREPKIVACEMEAQRALALRKNIPNSYHHTLIHGDAFRLTHSAQSGSGATVLFLNPPYDLDRDFGRLEARFLDRFTRYLYPGVGFLLYLVPVTALAASAEILAREYVDLRIWRLPEPDFQVFSQVLVVGRRAARPLARAPFAHRVRAWGADPDFLPVLPDRVADPYDVVLDRSTYFSLHPTLIPYDITAALDGFQPWQGVPIGVEFPVDQLLGARFETAMPPKPAHIALALASGMFDGREIEPNDPRRHPRLLAKGRFERNPIEVSVKRDERGQVISRVLVERPRLRLTVLRLDNYTFHELVDGAVPTGSDDLPAWNPGDLITYYDRSLARLLAQQFPPIHDPTALEHQIALPALARRPFRAQAQAVQTALKLLAVDRNPFFIAEVGTGKSTMALTTAAAMAPEHRAQTVAELARLGFDGSRLPVVRRTLIVCPPHLLDSWRSQAAAVVPGARVHVLSTLSDLDQPAEIYILSSSAAKLGPAIVGVSGRCPRCGARLERSAEENASRRLRCNAAPARPSNVPARLAEHLAALLARESPEDPQVLNVLSGRAATAVCRRPSRPLSSTELLSLLQTCTAALKLHLDRLDPQEAYPSLVDISAILDASLSIAEAGELNTLAHATLAALAERTANPNARCFLESRLATLLPARPFPDRLQRLLSALERLAGAGTWCEDDVCNEPLYSAAASPRRVPLARHILRRHRRAFDLLILDEAHEFNNPGSAQSKAAHRLTSLPRVPTLVLTGSPMGGYASGLFPNLWALSPAFREEFDRDECSAFVNRYGYRKLLQESGGDPKPSSNSRRGSHSDRELSRTSVIGEAPGILPDFLMRHLLPTAILVHKDDLDEELPPLTETPVALSPSAEDPLDLALLDEYHRLLGELMPRIRADRFVPGRSGKLLGALMELPSYLDRATDDLPPFEVVDPEDGVIATGRAFPSSWRTPKERWLADQVRARLATGEKILIFLRHTGTAALTQRLLSILSEVTPRVAWLDAKKVPTAKREAWIDQNVIGRGVDLLLVNPNAVRTGLNNLVRFNVGIWYELDTSATTFRQANGRLHRIGQTQPVTILTPYYAQTAQQVTFELVAKKVSAALQVDGLDLQAALEAAGAGEDQATAIASAMSIGRAVYEALSRS